VYNNYDLGFIIFSGAWYELYRRYPFGYWRFCRGFWGRFYVCLLIW